MTGRGKDGFSLLSLPLESFTKNLDAQRRNEKLGRNAPEPLFPRTGSRSGTNDQGRFSLFPFSPPALPLSSSRVFNRELGVRGVERKSVESLLRSREGEGESGN